MGLEYKSYLYETIWDNDLTTMWTLPSVTEMLEAKSYVIKQGLTYIQNKITETVISIDSKSALLSWKNPKPKTNKDFIYEIQTVINTQTNQNQIVILQ